MKGQFLFCSTVLGRKQYTVFDFSKEENCIEKIDYLLKHRQDAVLWPLFVKSDIKELLTMNPRLIKVLRGVVVYSDTCKFRYNGTIYQVEEITSGKMLKNYWQITTSEGTFQFDPKYIELL